MDVKREKPVGWVSCGPAKGNKFSSFTTARALLGETSHSPWGDDKDAPYLVAPLHLGQQDNGRIFSRSHREGQ
ncbi:MAG: hypothetical protein SGPRY_011080, partial [Prymnesium sp.]